MSDFIADLERELVAAAHRRAAGRRRFVMPRPRLAALVAVAAVFGFVLAAVAVVRGLEPSHSGDERPASPPGPGVTLALPAAEVAKPCPGAEQRVMDGETPPVVDMSVFARPRTQGDALPSLSDADSYTWITLGTVFPEASRRSGRYQFDEEVHLVAGAEPRRGGDCEAQLEADLGACLVVGDGEPVVKCFTVVEIRAGRALAVTGRGIVHGIAPDGIVSATLRWDGGAVTVAVPDNAFEAHVPLEAGDTVRVEFEQLGACRPSEELLDAVPALRDGGWHMLPAAAEDAMPSAGNRQWARHLGGDELDVWVVTRCEDAVRACVLAIHDAGSVAVPCGTAAEIREDGTWWLYPVAGRLGVAGLAPRGAARMHVILDGRRTHPVPVAGGVFAAILPPSFGSSVDPGRGDMSGRLEMRFR